MKTKTRNEQLRVFKNLNGGGDYRFSPLIIDAMSDKRMQSPALSNVDMFYTGSVSKRNGKVKQGDSLVSTAYASQSTHSTTKNISGTIGSKAGYAQKITTIGAVNVGSIDFYVAIAGTGQLDLQAFIYSDNSGTPNAEVGESSIFSASTGTTPQLISFTFPGTVLSATTDYWLIISGVGQFAFTFYTAGLNSGSLVKSSTDDLSSWSAVANYTLYYSLFSTSTSTVIQGIYDYRYGSASTQKILAVAGGAVFYHARNATPLTGAWTSIITGLSSGQDSLYSFATLKDYAFIAEGSVIQRAWNGTASYTIAQGFRATYTLTDSAAAGTVPPGVYKVMAVTTLKSGGFRASAPVSVTVGGASNHQIVVGSIVMDGTGASDFGFDIDATATKWFMTLVGGNTYYKIPGGNMSVANPAPNNTTTFNITATTGLSAANDLLTEYGVAPEYFINQINTPIGKYLQQFENMIALAGDASYPTRTWYSSVKEPMIMAAPTAGTQVYGAYVDYADGGDNEVIVGIRSHKGYLFVFKRHSVYVTETTGNASANFSSRRISENIGALSHWCIKSTGDNLVFLSERGPMEIIGTTVRPLQAAQPILSRFEPNDPNRYNLSAMKFTTAGINSTKSQIHWGVSSKSATTRDLTFVYDFENGVFWENDASANFYSEVTDSNFFPTVWAGDYSAQIFQTDSGTSDNGSAISFNFSTPNVKFGNPFNKTQVNYMLVAGDVQSSGTLYADVYTDFSSTAFATFTFDMTDTRFKSGISVPLGYICDYIRVNLYNSQAATPVKVDAIGFGVQDLGQRM